MSTAPLPHLNITVSSLAPAEAGSDGGGETEYPPTMRAMLMLALVPSPFRVGTVCESF